MDVDNCLLGANKLYNFSLRNRFIVYPHSIYSATVQLSRLLFAFSSTSCDRKQFYLPRHKNKLVESSRQNVALNHSPKAVEQMYLLDMWKSLFTSSLWRLTSLCSKCYLKSFGHYTAVGWEHINDNYIQRLTSASQKNAEDFISDDDGSPFSFVLILISVARKTVSSIQPVAGHWILVPAIKIRVICFVSLLHHTALLREQRFRSNRDCFDCFREVF